MFFRLLDLLTFGLLTSRRSSNVPAQAPTPVMSPADRAAVLRLAVGDTSAHEEAVAAYRNMLHQGMGCDNDPAMMFMHEVDHSNPDLALKAVMRHRLLSTISEKDLPALCK